PSTALRAITRPLVVSVSTFVVAPLTDGVSATGSTVSRNVSIAVSGVPPTVFDTVTVIVAVPERVAPGAIVSVHGEAPPVPRSPAFGASNWSFDVATAAEQLVVPSPTLNGTDSGVSSAVVLSVTSSIVGLASRAPMSTVATALPAAATIRPNGAPR